MNTLYKICLGLVIIGAINWGMIGVFDVNLVSLIFGKDSIISNIVYFYQISTFKIANIFLYLPISFDICYFL